MTEATLGFKIDSSQASSAAADLDRLTAAASRTQQAADKLESEASTLGSALSRAGEGAGRASQPLERVGKALADQDEHVRAFRMEVERLTLKYQPLAQATRNYETVVSEIERAHKIGAISAQQMTQALDRERQAYERLRTSAATAGAAVKAANSNGGASRSFNTSNLAAQGFDIGSTAAFMPWYTVALQQGPQVSQVFNDIKASGQAIGPAVAGAFMQILNPISLVTIGVIGGVAALVQYFSTSREGSDGMNADLREQAELISGIADRWGDAIPSLKQYADELNRAKEASELQAGVGLLSAKTLKDVRSGLDDAKIGLADLASQLRLAGTESETIVQLENAFSRFTKAADEGKITTEQVSAVQTALTAAVKENHIPALDEFAKVFDQIAKSALTAADSIGKTGEAAALAQSRMNDPRTWRSFGRNDLFGADGTIQGSDFNLPDIGPTPAQRPNDLSQDPGAPTILNGDGRLVNVPVPGQKPNFFEIDDQTDKVTDLEKAYRRAQEAKADFWLDISFQQRQAERSAMDQQVAGTLNRYGLNEDLNSPEANAIRQQLRGQEARDIAKDFGDAFSSELISGSHNIGKAFLAGFESALNNYTSKLWGKFFDGFANQFADWMTGTKGGGNSAASSVASALLGGKAANDNVGTAPVIPVTRSMLGDLTSAANAIKSIESSGNYGALGPITKSGDRAYGAYQVMGANVGPWTKSALGTSLTPSAFLASPSAQDAVFSKIFGGYTSKFGASGAAQAWFGGPGSVGKGGGAADMLGTTGTEYVSKFNTALSKLSDTTSSATGTMGNFGPAVGSAAQGLNQFGNGVSVFGQNLSNSFPDAPGGGGGFLSKIFGGLFGGGLNGYGNSVLSSSSQFAGAWAGGGIGLFADGTDFAPGGLAVVGEEGPELIELPMGSRVHTNQKTMGMLSAAGQVANSNNVNVDVKVINNNGSDVKVQQKQTANGVQLDVIIDQAVADKISTPGSQSRTAVASQFGLKGTLARR
jgi:hypothetical protein